MSDLTDELEAYVKTHHIPTLPYDLITRNLMEIRRLEAELERHQWVPVAERLPDEHVDVMSYSINAESDHFQLAFVERGRWRTYARYGSFQFDGVTHWKPITPPTPRR